MKNKITYFNRTFAISERTRKGSHMGMTSFACLTLPPIEGLSVINELTREYPFEKRELC